MEELNININDSLSITENISIKEIAYQDFTTFTEIDPNSHISKTRKRVTFSQLNADEVAYVYKDYGINCFDGGFIHDIDIYLDNESVNIGNNFIVYSNNIGNMKAHDDNTWDYQGMYFFGATSSIGVVSVESDGGDVYFDGPSYISKNKLYYMRIVRDENVGTYGTMYVYIYTNSERTEEYELVSHTITLHSSKKDFRYLYITSNDNAAGDDTDIITGYFENLNIYIIYLPISDTLTITEDITITVFPPDLNIDIYDSFSFSEDVTSELPNDLEININDNISISEDIDRNISNLEIDVSDSISISEDIAELWISFIEVNNTVSITENIATELPNDLEININDDISITENITIKLPDDLDISIYDSISINEDINVSVAQLTLEVNVSTTISISEDININKVFNTNISSTNKQTVRIFD